MSPVALRKRWKNILSYYRIRRRTTVIFLFYICWQMLTLNTLIPFLVRPTAWCYCWWMKSCTSWSWQFFLLFTRFYTSQVVVWDFWTISRMLSRKLREVFLHSLQPSPILHSLHACQAACEELFNSLFKDCSFAERMTCSDIGGLSKLAGGFKYFCHPYLGKISNLTSIFSNGWFNHQAEN